MKLLLGLITSFLFTSCAFHHGTFQGSACVTNNQYRIAGTAKGSAEIVQLLGIGGLGKDALVNEAKKDLYAKYPIPKGMMLGNVTVNFKTTYALIVRKTKVFIVADIIDFNPATINANYKGFYTEDSTYFPSRNEMSGIEMFNGEDLNGNGVSLNDQVTFLINMNRVDGKIIAINSYGIKCQYETPQGTKKIYLLPEDIILKSR